MEIIDQEVAESIYTNSYREKYSWDEFASKILVGIDLLQSKHKLVSTVNISVAVINQHEYERIALEYSQACLMKHLLN